ncbi:BTB/POZ domain-containing protein SR1IP1 [Linum perenne]
MVEELANMSQKKDLLSSAMKRTSEWIISQEISSDVTVYVGGASFSLHKFLLVSKSGYMRKLVSDADVSEVRIPEIPGGVDAFELAAKFCYGINFEIGTENIAVLRCVAEYLEMTEEYAVGNLVSRTEAYLNEVTLKSLTGAVSVLQSTESLGPIAEKVKLVNRCIDSIALITCKESSQFSMPGRSDGAIDGLLSPTVSQPKPPMVDWWAEDLTVLRIDMFQRVLIAMVSRGFKQYALGPILMLYAKKSLRGLEAFSKGRKKIEPQREHEKRVVLETIVSLLPKEKNALSVSFLSMLLRAAIYLESTVACRLDLEKRMASQLGQAVLDDLLIPAYSFTGDTLFDVDTVKRIMINYIEYEVEGKDRLGYHGADDEPVYSPRVNDMERVGKLMENYLAEIASDRNLAVSKFISLAELVPEQSRIVDDEMYRAIDIYLKAHPALSDLERKKVCSVMDCQKLSREACAHAAQNDRLPVQTVVQVLYYEQQRLRDSMNVDHPTTPTNKAPYSIDVHPVPDELSILKRENQDLKFELLKMKMKLRELEKFSSASSSTARSTGDSPMGISNSSPSAADKPPLPPKKTSFINSVSKKLGKLSPFVGVLPSKPRKKPPKDRRHSIS